MKTVLLSMVTLFAICTLLLPVTASADTATSSTLLLQCGAADRDASAPASSPATVSSVAVSSVAAPSTPVPEPSTWLLLGAGLLGLFGVARRKS